MFLVVNTFNGEINADYSFNPDLVPDGWITQIAGLLPRPQRQETRTGAGPDAD